MPGNFTGGLGSQVGMIKEVTYGTGVTVTKFFEYNNEAMNLSRAFIMSQGLKAGRMYQQSARRIPTTKAAAGTVAMDVPSMNFENFLWLLSGENPTYTKIGAGTAYEVTHKIGTTDSYEKSMTLQIGKPNTAGTVDPYTYVGSIITSLAFSCQTGGVLECTATVDARDELTATALATAAYASPIESFDFTDAKVEVNSVVQAEVRGVTLTINAPKDTGRYYLGAELKAKPLTNAYNTGTGTLTVDYGSTALYKLFAEGKIIPMKLTFNGPLTISEANTAKMEFTVAAAGLDGDSPNVAGPGPLQQSINFVFLDNATNPPIEVKVVSLAKEL